MLYSRLGELIFDGEEFIAREQFFVADALYEVRMVQADDWSEYDLLASSELKNMARFWKT